MSPPSPWRALGALLRPYRAPLAGAAAASMVYAAAFNVRNVLVEPILGAFLSRWQTGTPVQTRARAPATGGEFCALAVAVAALALVQAVAAVLRDRLQKRTLVRALLGLRLRVAGHLLDVPIARYVRERLGDMLARLTTDVRASEDAIRILGITAWEHAAMLVVGVAAAAWLSPMLTLLAVVPFVPVAAGLLFATGGRVRRRSAKSLAALADLTETMQQTLAGLEVIKAHHTEAREAARYAAASETQLDRSRKVGAARARARAVMEFAVNAAMAGAVWLGGWLVLRGFVTIETFAAFVTVLAGLYTPLRGLGQVWSALQESLPAVGRAGAVLAWPPEPPDPPDARPCPRLATGLAFERVTFQHEGSEVPALAEVSCVIPAGRMTAVVGESGAGKSTLLDLVLRLADPTAGRITWDGIDLRQLGRGGLRARLALVAQEPFLFHASAEENLRYGRPDATREACEAAARAADVHDVLLALPEGYATPLGERGVRLSGGERQRLTIARALLRDPDLLLLDEATAALDSVSEARVVAAIRRLAVGRTTLWVAHRLATVVEADQILVLEAGRVVEQGTHAALLAADGAYARLWRRQTWAGTAAGAA